MSFVDKLVENKPSKYDTLIDNKIVTRKIKMKTRQYNALQDQYANLLKNETINRKPAAGGWKKIDGKLEQISASGKDWLWGINANSQIYTCEKPCDGGNWIQIPGELKQIEGGDKEVWGVNKNNSIYKMNQDHSNGWRQIPGKLKFVSQGGGWVWGVSKDNKVYRCKSPCDGDWILDLIPTPSTITKVFNYLGNWKDEGNRRLPVTIDRGQYKYTKASCNEACQGYKYYGLQNGNGYKGQCFCGNNWSRASSLGKCGGNKITGGGWCNSIYDTKKEDELITINIGRSKRRTKKVKLPYDNMIVSPFALNKQNPGWGDKFEVKVSGRELIVTRTDANAGWGQPLKLQGIRNDIPSPNNVQEGPTMEMLSCSVVHVYGLDHKGHVWRKNIDGTGIWERFGNPSTMQFRWLNASSNNKVYATHSKVFNSVETSIYETDMNGKEKWSKLAKQFTNSKSDIFSVSSDKEGVYSTRRDDNLIFKYSPFKNGGYWSDIQNENYMTGLVNEDGTSNDNFTYLGKTDNLKECKIKAVEDDKNEFSSVTYVSDKAGSPFSKSCYGNVIGGKNNSTYQQHVTTSLAPNGTSRLGGEEGKKLMKEMKKVHDEIEELSQKARGNTVEMKDTNSLLFAKKTTVNSETEELLAKLRMDRIEINKILEEPDEIAKEENSNTRQTNNYVIYVLWILLVIISLFMVYYMLISRDENISPIIYIFLAVWIIILGKQYYNQIVYYGGSSVSYLNKLLANPTG